MIIDFKIIVIDFIKLIKFIGAISFHVFKGSEASERPENQSNKKLLLYDKFKDLFHKSNIEQIHNMTGINLNMIQRRNKT